MFSQVSVILFKFASWSIQTELERDRERELNQYYANPFTLQQELELMQIGTYKIP